MQQTRPDTRSVRRSTYVALGVFVVLLIAYVINSVDRISFALFVTDVRHEYGFGLGAGGLLSTISNLGMGLAGIPTGFLLARLSRKAVVNIGILLFSLTTFLTVVSVGFWDMLVYRIVSGFGEAMQLTALLTIAAAMFSRYRGAAVGAVNCSFAIGSFLGPSVGGMLLSSYDSWRIPMVSFAAVGLIAAGVILLFVPRRVTDPAEPESPTQAAGEGSAGAVVGGSPTIVNRNTLLLVPMTMIGGLVTFGFLGMYPTFLREELHYSASQAGFVASLAGIGALASLVGGYLGDLIGPRLVLGGCYLGTAVIGFLLFAGPTSVVAQSILSLAFGVVFSGVVYVNLAAYLVKSVSELKSGRASGLFVTSMYVPAAFAGYLMGRVADVAGWATAGIILLTLFSLFAAAVAVALRPRTFSRPALPDRPESSG